MKRNSGLLTSKRNGATAPPAGREHLSDVLPDSELIEALHEVRSYRDVLAKQMEELRATRRLLDLTRARQTESLELGPLPYVTVDGQSQIRSINRSGAKLLGAAVNDLIGVSFFRFVSLHKQDFLAQSLGRCRETDSCENFELELHTVEGQHIPVLVICRSSQFGSPETRFVRMGITDISDRKQKETKLQDYALQLQEANASLQMRTVQLQRLSMQLCGAEQRERHRIAHVLHDQVQQILVACKMSVDMMISQAPQLSPTGSEVVSMLHQAINELRTLASHLRPPALRDQGLMASLHWLAEEMEAKHVLKVRLHSEFGLERLPPHMHDQLFQIIRELLFNVVKHAKINLADVFFSIDPEAHALCATVRDAGRGIERSAQGEGKEHFGLSMIRERVAAYGGELQIESSPGHGTAVTVRLPLHAVTEPMEEAVTEAAADPDGESALKVLIADDHSIVRQGLTMLLQREPNIQVIGEVGDGEEALEFARRHMPDVVLMDVSMPRMDGVEATRLLKAQFPHIGVVGLSMYGEDEMSDAIREAGADDYVSKVAPAEELVGAIRRSVHTVA